MRIQKRWAAIDIYIVIIVAKQCVCVRDEKKEFMRWSLAACTLFSGNEQSLTLQCICCFCCYWDSIDLHTQALDLKNERFSVCGSHQLKYTRTHTRVHALAPHQHIYRYYIYAHSAPQFAAKRRKSAAQSVCALIRLGPTNSINGAWMRLTD